MPSFYRLFCFSVPTLRCNTTQGLFYIPFIPMSAEYATPCCDNFAKLYNAIVHTIR